MKNSAVAGLSFIAHPDPCCRSTGDKDERDNVDKFFVRCGEYNVKAATELLAHQETKVAELIFHPEYDARCN